MLIECIQLPRWDRMLKEEEMSYIKSLVLTLTIIMAIQTFFIMELHSEVKAIRSTQAAMLGLGGG